MLSENIKIAVLGPVSAGKTTFFNSLCSDRMSDMMRKKTTMLPQIYQITNDGEIDSTETIYERNKTSNEKILDLRERGEFNIQTNFEEIIHKINPIPEFIQLPDTDAIYSILDMPGLNCGGDTLYYDYIRRVSKTIDIYLLVFDINSALNTTDEINILKLVVDEIKKNNHVYVHILINKCDNIQFDCGEVNLQDKELNDIYASCIEIILKHCAEIVAKVSISPLCSNKLYTYRCIKNNITTIDESHLDYIIKEECGKGGLAKLTNITAKREFVLELVNSATYNDWIKNTGYNQFIYTLDNILKNYSEMVFYHINADVAKLNMTEIDFDIIYDQMDTINTRIKRALQYSIDATAPPQYLLDSLSAINKKLDVHLLSKYSQSSIGTIDGILLKMNGYCSMLRNLFVVNEVEKSEAQLSEIRITNIEHNFINEGFNYEMFVELCNSGRAGWTKFGDDVDTIELQSAMSNANLYMPFKSSINNTLDKSIESVVEIAKQIHKNDIYYSILIDIFITKLEKIKINKEVFLQFLTKLVVDFSYDLVSISKTITNFMITNSNFNREDEGVYAITKIICTHWLTLNSEQIRESRREIQYIYFMSRTFKTYQSVDSVFKHVNFEQYGEIMDLLDSIFKIISFGLNFALGCSESDADSIIDFSSDDQLSLAELKEKCKQLNLKGYSKKNKAQLLELLANS